MTDMIAAEPAVAGRIVERLAGPGPAAELAAAIRAALDGRRAGRPDRLRHVGAWRARRRPRSCGRPPASAGLDASRITAEQAFELSLGVADRGLVIGITHEGATAATNAALQAARAAGAATAVITVSDRSPAAELAGIVVATGELDQGWCHTVGYLSPVVAAAAVGAHLSGRALDARRVADLVRRRDDRSRPAPSGSPRASPTPRDLLVIASGADRPAGRELVLKVEEASWLPSAYRDLETFLHGHLPGDRRRRPGWS